METGRNLSFTSASALPMKIFKDMALMKSLNDEHKVLPRHVQLSPTNKCNLNCSFCSCRDRDKNLELSKHDIDDLLEILEKVKTHGVTITGGGEPLLFGHFDYLIERLKQSNIDIGVTTNGILFKRICTNTINLCTWIRVSVSDYSVFSDTFIKSLDYAVQSGSNVDFGFSYVVTDKPDISKIIKTVDYANQNGFTHVRLANDILMSNKSNLIRIKEELQNRNIDDDIIIYQDRQEMCQGQKTCPNLQSPLPGRKFLEK